MNLLVKECGQTLCNIVAISILNVTITVGQSMCYGKTILGSHTKMAYTNYNNWYFLVETHHVQNLKKNLNNYITLAPGFGKSTQKDHFRF